MSEYARALEDLESANIALNKAYEENNKVEIERLTKEIKRLQSDIGLLKQEMIADYD